MTADVMHGLRWLALWLCTLTAACDATRGEVARAQAEVVTDLIPAGGSVRAGDIEVIEPWILSTPNPSLAAAYLTLRNVGANAATLKSVSGNVAERFELHESLEQGGMVRMVPHPDGFEVRPGGEIALERGGKHLMLIGLSAPLERGRSVALELAFFPEQKLVVQFPVREAKDLLGDD